MSVMSGRGDKGMAVTLESAAAEWFGRFDDPQEEQQ